MPDNSPEINFHSDAPEEMSSSQKIVDWSIKSGKKIIIITEAIVLISLFAKFKLVRDSNAVNYKLENLRLEVLQNTETEKRFNQILTDINKFKEVQSTQIDWIDRFNIINQYVADEIILKETVNETDQTTIKAEVSDIRAFGVFIGRLLSDDKIEKLTLNSSQFDNETNLFKFEATLKIKQ